MNPIYKFISIILICSLLASCSTTQKIQVSGLAGTEIYTPDRTKVGTINSTGSAEITLNSNAYYAYLLSKDSGSNKYIPFALDYKNHNYIGTKIAAGAGYTLASFGLIAVTGGLIGAAVAGDDDDMTATSSVIVVAGFGLAGAGVGIGMPADERMKQTDHAYQFKYLPTQTTNQDLSFTKPQLVVVNQPKKETKKASQKKDNNSTKKSSKSTKKLNSKSTKSFKDYGLAIEGTYVGSGSLTLENEVVETYDDIIVKIIRIDNDSVEVIVTEANGEDFFGESSVYSIKKGQKNTFTLTHEDIAKATIKIDRNKKAIYIHPQVDIDGEIYTLKITATLQK